MADYVSTAEINEFLWISWEDALVVVLNWIATSKINNFLGVTDLNAKVWWEEIQDYTWKAEYILKELNPSNITLVNDSSVIWDTNITWRLLTFEYAPNNTDIVFNKIKFTYDYWFSTIPADIKMAVFWIVWYLYNSRKTAGVASFTQWQISVSYTADDNFKIENIISGLLKKYIKNNIYC